MDEKKKYEKPEASVVAFNCDDIITGSLNDYEGDLLWGGEDNQENM